MRPSTPQNVKPHPRRGQVVRVPLPNETKKRPAVVIRVDEKDKMRALIVYFTTTRNDYWGERIEVTFGTRDFQLLGFDNTCFAYGGANKIPPTVRSAAFEHLTTEAGRCPAGLLVELSRLVDNALLRMTAEQLRADLPDAQLSAAQAPPSSR